MAASFAFYLSLIVTLCGAIGMIRPSASLGFTRARAGTACLTGLLAAAVALSVPARTRHAQGNGTALDTLMPAFQFHEIHSTVVNAEQPRVYEAIRELRANEIFLFKTLTTIRRFGRPGPESILNPPNDVPLLEVATRTTFRVLAEDPPREVVIGTVLIAPRSVRGRIEQMRSLFESTVPPGYAIAAMNFHVVPSGSGSRVTTETRVYASDAASARRFAWYWRVIYPGSAWIRRMWLRAIRLRAEGA